jgi:hypothetical protein
MVSPSPANHDSRSLAVFCDFENIALGVQDAKYAQFDIARVLEKLLLKGSGIATSSSRCRCTAPRSS